METDALNPATTVSKQHEHEHKARRLRGGGAARVCPVPFPPRSTASISFPRLSQYYELTTRISPFGLQDCFIGMIECFICFGALPFIPSNLRANRNSCDLPFHRMLQGSYLLRPICLPSSSWLLPHRIPFIFISKKKFLFHFTFRVANRKTLFIQDCCECFADIVCKSPSPLLSPSSLSVLTNACVSH
jgi:hypothetical protein